MKKIIGVLCIAVTLGFASLAAAQDAPRREDGRATVQGRAGDGGVDIRVQGQKNERPSTAERGTVGPQGPAGAPGPQGPTGPSGGTSTSSTTVMGMDPTIALLIGLGVLALVIVAIVAASRGGETHTHTH